MSSFPAILLSLLAAPAAAPTYDTLVVCPPEFRSALAPWLEYRSAQGHRISVVEPASTAEAVRGQIRSVARSHKLRYVVLIGDAPGGQQNYASRRTVPVSYRPATVTVRWGSEPLIATDNWYADLDDDDLPDVAIGRITADSPEELSLITGKTIAYEQTADFSQWRRRVNFVAGIGGFGALADTAIELAAKKLITDGIPASYATSMTYASWRSAYCPSPPNFRQATVDRLREGCLFWVYLGHGQHRELDWVRAPGCAYPVLGERDIPQIRCTSGTPIACFLSCYAGSFDGAEDCLAEQMLRTSGAPVAVVCGSRVTMPYAMAVLGTELLDECFARRSPTLGDALRSAKRSMVRPGKKTENRASLDALAGVLSPSPDQLESELKEHLQLFNLVGDPCLRLHHPQDIDLTFEGTAQAGGKIQVRGSSPIAGNCTLELITRRDRLTFTPPARPQYADGTAALEKIDADYRRANDPRYVVVEQRIKKGPFSAELVVPADAYGPGHVRMYVEGKADFAVGSADLTFQRVVKAGPAALNQRASVKRVAR